MLPETRRKKGRSLDALLACCIESYAAKGLSGREAAPEPRSLCSIRSEAAR